MHGAERSAMEGRSVGKLRLSPERSCPITDFAGAPDYSSLDAFSRMSLDPFDPFDSYFTPSLVRS